MDINKIIEEGEKEFEKLRRDYIEDYDWDNYKNWHNSQQHKLLQSIVEEIEGMKKEVKYKGGTDISKILKEGSQNYGYNQALSDIKAKLLSSNSKEE